MRFSIDPYRIIQKKLDDIEEDCDKFDMEENIEAGVRIRVSLRKLKKKINAMITETLEISDDIKRSRGKKTSADYWAEWKKDGRAEAYIAMKQQKKEARKKRQADEKERQTRGDARRRKNEKEKEKQRQEEIKERRRRGNAKKNQA